MGFLDRLPWSRNRKAELPLDTRSPEELAERARSLRELGRYDEAIEVLKTLVSQYPGAICILGNTYKESGRTKEARDWFQRGVDLGESIGVDNNLAARMLVSESFANLGELEWEQGNGEIGVEMLQKVVSLWGATNPHDAKEMQFRTISVSAVMLSLAKKYIHLGDLTSAHIWAHGRLYCTPECSDARAILSALGLCNECTPTRIVV